MAKHQVMAHRGWSGRYPENTLAAIQAALADENVDSIEIDVQLSKDGKPVIIHDFTLERTTNGDGLLNRYTFAELKELNAGKWFDQSFSGEKIPSLAEVLELVAGKKLLNIELKSAGDLYPNLAKKIIDVLESYPYQNQIMLSSFDHEVIKKVHLLNAEIKTGLIILGRPLLISEQLEAAGASVMSMAYPYITQDLIDELSNKGYSIIAWTVDEEQAITNLQKIIGPITICTNFPDRVK